MIENILLYSIITLSGLLIIILIYASIMIVVTSKKIKKIRNKLLEIEIERNVLLQEIKRIEQEQVWIKSIFHGEWIILMFQSGKTRTRHDDKHLCVDCIHDQDCTVKPNYTPSWRYVLTFCARFSGKLGYKRNNKSE